MGIKTFKGGIFPREWKELAKDSPIQAVLPKGELVFPLSQHIGAPAVPVVEDGKVTDWWKVAARDRRLTL